MKIIQSSDEGQNFTNLFEACPTVVKECSTCVEIKPRWSKPTSLPVIHATEPWQCLSIDFMVGKPIS